MEDQNRNERNLSNKRKWEQDRNRHKEEQSNQQNNMDQGYTDLDGDGFVGHTGGFYGGTSYLGANYDDWNNNLGQSSYNDQYGNQNQQRNRSQQDRHRSHHNRDDQYYYNQDNPYGNPNYQRMSGNVGYGRGFENQPSYNSRRYNDDSYRNDNSQQNRDYSGASNYGANSGSYENRMRSEYNQRGEWLDSPYGGSQNSYGNKSDWDRMRDHTRNQHHRHHDRNWLERAADKVSSWFGSDEDNRKHSDQRTNMSGPHRGKGPKGYQRSTERIRDDVHDRLHDDPFVDASEIEVEVSQNEVILKGFVETREAKRRAEDLVESISGVRNVENRLRVGRPDTHFGSNDSNKSSSADKGQTKGRGDTDRDITV